MLIPDYSVGGGDATVYSRRIDIWSIGATALELLTSRRPFHECKTAFEITFKLSQGKTPTIPDDMDPDGRSFCEACLKRNPHERASLEELLAHPFVLNYESSTEVQPMELDE